MGGEYVTALGQTNESRGWKNGKADGGILIDVASNEIVAQGFTMPHSPRWYAGKIWVLNSGEGELQIVGPINGQRDTVARLPGYTRGRASVLRWPVSANRDFHSLAENIFEWNS